ncbi:hypothetical protein FOVG_03643 [Fusarium oxysporum f. sp. pisi HDV247]|uniref:Uncharacterized protein n=1 Tax=Fusarium oxysporum f. sp. pisi HDV247 TaxID=1080344 RepID=W9Q106_FUSOX|nr:hypothetical protein FOVG_03643 [Fusarium oxysporum f. sp. pisi HDV247]
MVSRAASKARAPAWSNDSSTASLATHFPNACALCQKVLFAATASMTSGATASTAPSVAAAPVPSATRVAYASLAAISVATASPAAVVATSAPIASSAIMADDVYGNTRGSICLWPGSYKIPCALCSKIENNNQLFIFSIQTTSRDPKLQYYSICLTFLASMFTTISFLPS